MNPPARHWTALGVLAGITATTGVSFVLFKASVLAQLPFAQGESTWFISAHNLVPRFLLGALLLCVIYRGRVFQLTRSEWRQAMFLATTSFSGCLLQNDGIQRTSAATTAFLTQFYVILIPLWWALLHRKRPSWSVVVAALMVLVGVAVLARMDWHTFRIGRGEAEVLLATVFFSFMLSSLNWPAFAGNRAERTSTVMFLLEAGLFAIVASATCRDSAHWFAPYTSPSWLVLVVVTAVFGTAGPFVIDMMSNEFVRTEGSLLLAYRNKVHAARTASREADTHRSQ